MVKNLKTQTCFPSHHRSTSAQRKTRFFVPFNSHGYTDKHAWDFAWRSLPAKENIISATPPTPSVFADTEESIAQQGAQCHTALLWVCTHLRNLGQVDSKYNTRRRFTKRATHPNPERSTLRLRSAMLSKDTPRPSHCKLKRGSNPYFTSPTN